MTRQSVNLTAAHEDEHAKQSLRLWLKLLGTTTLIEKHIRGKLSSEFKTTLPRFDVLAALYRRPEGLTLSELSNLLLVSNGNVTGLINRLTKEGLVLREVNPQDRRAQFVTLTREGRKLFEKWARTHEDWIEDVVGHLSRREVQQLTRLLEKIKRQTVKTIEESAKP